MKNQMLIDAQAEIDAKIDANLSPTDKQDYEKICVAGLKAIFSKELHQEFAQSVRESQKPLNTVLEGIISLLFILRSKSQGTMPQAPMVLAGQSLLMNALDFMEESGMIKLNQQVLDEVTQKYIETILPKIGITHDKMQAVMGKAQGVMDDPQKMAQYKKSLGK